MRPDTTTAELIRFRCGCGRSVVTEHGTLADDLRACSRCRRRRAIAFYADLCRP